MTMSDSTSSGLGVVLEEALPVSWRPLEAPVSPDEQLRLAAHNNEILQVVLALDEHHVEWGEEQAELAAELQRLEFKLNLVMEMLAQVLAQHLRLPPRAAVRLAVDHIEWADTRAPVPGSLVQVELYLCARYPRALILPAMAERAPPGQACARFQPMDHAMQEALEKIIFRQHRRRIASARRHPARS
jgi:hypothetical protein